MLVNGTVQPVSFLSSLHRLNLNEVYVKCYLPHAVRAPRDELVSQRSWWSSMGLEHQDKILVL